MLTENGDAIFVAGKTQVDAANLSNDRPKSLGQLEETDWDLLLRRIRDGHCTPFIGGEACLGMNQFRSGIVGEWAERYKDYPFAKANDLPRAAQFVAIKEDPAFPKEQVAEAMRKSPQPELKDPHNLFRVLAELPFPAYITTNYHDLMEQALKSQPNPRDVRMEFCRWDPALRDPPSIFERESPFEPTVANPVVFHLYGHMSVAESLVLTEDDYFDFLIDVSEEGNRIPPRIQRALTSTNLLFLGYRIFDWDFRILFRIVARFFRKNPTRGRRFHVAVQIETAEETASVEQRQRIKDYFRQYFESFDIQVYWGTCREFAAELLMRWEKAKKQWEESQNAR